MIQLSQLHFSYPQSNFKLDIEDLSFEAKSKSAIIGPSGSGKTTLLNLLAGIILPNNGAVKVNDQLLHQLSERERRNYRIQNIGFVFQDFRLLPYLSVLDNILLTFRINNLLQIKKDSKTKAMELANELNIGHLIHKYPSKLSHGEKQRVAIARALINSPKLILADEPTGNLDPENKAHIKSILFETVNKFDATVITVTHDHEMLHGYDRIIDFNELRKGGKP